VRSCSCAADAVGVQRDQAQVGRAVLGGKGGGQLGGAGGLADTGGADQGVHAAHVFQRLSRSAVGRLRSSTPAAQAISSPPVSGRLSTSLRIKAARSHVQQLLRQLRLARLALQLLHEGQGAEALFDQAAHRAQLAHHLDLCEARPC
jgi:hypothetical protein